jgi:hypothetical protein
MVNERITGVDLGRKDLFVSISHPNKAQCVVKKWSNGQYQFESGLAIWNSQLKQWKRKDRGIRIFEADIMFLKSCGLLPSSTSNAGTADTFSGFTTAGRRPSTSCAVSWQLIPTLSPSEIQSSARRHEAMLLHQLSLLLRLYRISILEFTKTEGRVNWRVQRCNNCGVYWNRDVNAARNMRALYVYQRDNNGARIPAFERPE